MYVVTYYFRWYLSTRMATTRSTQIVAINTLFGYYVASYYTGHTVAT